MRQYTSSEWPSPSYIFLYVALCEKSLNTPALANVNMTVKPLNLSSSRSKPAEDSEGTDPSTSSTDSWMTGSPDTELELEEPEDMPGLGGEELPHILLPDSLSQLEEFGRHKRPRKTHRGHGRPRLFSDLWVRIGDR